MYMSGMDHNWPKRLFEVFVVDLEDLPIRKWRTVGRGWMSTGDHEPFVSTERLTKEQLEDLAVAVDRELKKRGQ